MRLRAATAIGLSWALCLGGGGFAAAPPGAAKDPLFNGARMGMPKADLLALPAMKSQAPDCAHVVLVSQPRDTRVAVCTASDKSPSGGSLDVTYVLSPDPDGVERVINMSVHGAPQDGTWALERLTARFGTPSYTGRRAARGPDGGPQQATIWTLAGQQVMYRQPCQLESNFCIDFSDSNYARNVTQQLGLI